MRRVILNVRASEERGCLVAHLEALEAGLRRFVGWEFDAERSGWRAKPDGERLEPSSPDHLAEYLRAIRGGELMPADDQTRELAGLPKAAAAKTPKTKEAQ